jgi:hypothetical protein
MDPGQQLVAICISFTILGWLFVALRCYVRLKIVQSFGCDDWLMVLSLVSLDKTNTCVRWLNSLHVQIGSSIYVAFVIASVHYGLGAHIGDLTPDKVIGALKARILCNWDWMEPGLLYQCSIKYSVKYRTFSQPSSSNSASAFCYFESPYSRYTDTSFGPIWP